jgi:site-specific DNA-methyltransferase (adenine-specific)
MAAKQLGWDEIAVLVTDDDPETARARLLADNKTAAISGTDDALLARMLADIGSDEILLAATAYTDSEIAALLHSLEPELGEEDLSDEALALPADPITKPGDLWVLGKHRLVCGDATSPKDIAKVMGGGLAAMVFTDPPYGVDIGEKNKFLNSVGPSNRVEARMSSDDLSIAGLRLFLDQALGNALGATAHGGAWFVCGPGGPPTEAFCVSLNGLGILRQILVWVKDGFVLGRSDYHGRYENLFYGWAPGATHHAPPTRSEDSVWEFPRPRASGDHPTMKPVALVERAICNHTDGDAVVLDPFGGSGSTLIACEQTGRSARLLEIDPHYCDVICRRFERLTGIRPKRGNKSISFLD